MRVLLLGGSKSGKSTAAQHLCRALGGGGPLYYWATMTPRDEEDRARIARHIADRDGWGFATVERPRDLPGALEQVEAAGCVLFDSVTAALSERMFGAEFAENAPDIVAEELLTVSRHVRHFVAVCDDIFRGGETYEDWTEVYVRGLAAIARRLAAEFDVVCEMSGGLPHLWKGEWPL